MSSSPPPTPPPRTKSKRKKPIQPSPIPPEVSNTGESSDAVYQNAAAVAGTPPKKNLDSVQYENVNPSSITSGPSDVEDAQEKKKPVARTRNSIRNRGGGPMDSAPVPALGQSPPLFEVEGGGRGESLSPDPRNNAPSPKPKPRGKRNLPDNRSFDGNDNSAESRAPPPLPPAKPSSGAVSPASGRRGPPEPPPKIPKTMVTDVTSSSSSLAGKKKPIPPPPRKESTPERRSGGAFLSNKQSSTGGLDRTEVQANDLVTDEDPYSPIDRTQFTDTGPSIQVLDERSGKTLPLDFVERELETAGEADTSKSSSILDAIMSLVGDEVLADIESDEDQHGAAKQMTVHRDFEFSDEAPPIPAHTMASMELVEPAMPTSRDSGGGGGAVGGGRGGGNGDLLLSTYDVVGATTDSVYEQPAEPPRLVLPISTQKASSFHGPHVGKDVPPPLPSPNKPIESTSTAVAIATMARSTNDTTLSNNSAHSKLKKGLFSAFKKDKKKDKDKVSAEEVSGPITFGTGIVKSPSINTMSSSTSSSHSPMHDRANNKYNFPGDLGYGVRIKKPIGPRREPPHWANSLSPPIANKA